MTTDRPKVMIPVVGKPVLRRHIDRFKAQDINNITVVAGYRHEAVDARGAKLVVNDQWESGNELTSLDCAVDALTDDTVILYGDLVFRSYILSNLLDWEADLLVVVDSTPVDSVAGNINDLAWCTEPDDRAMYQQKVKLERVQSRNAVADRPPDGRWIGLLRARGQGIRQLKEALEQLRKNGDFESLSVPDLLNRLIENGHAPQVQYVSGHWMDINSMADLQRASDFAHGQNT